MDQTLFAERGVDELEHGWRLGAEVRGLIDDIAVVLVDAAGAPLETERGSRGYPSSKPAQRVCERSPNVDADGGTPDTGRNRNPECVDETCVVAVFDATWNPRAVPYDRVETNAGAVVVYLPPGSDVKVHAYHSDGSLVFQRLLKTPP
ncbi:MAG: hypothetical protein OXG44_01600 [Gammaproteobacteria bacterium]|nr:hypothetical protein [Gammaproteobacteria bacterium]